MNVFFYYYLLPQRDLSSCDRVPRSVFGLMSLFCSMSRVAGWCLLKRLLSIQTSFTHTCLKKVLRKLEKHLRRDVFFESCWITDHDLFKVVKFNRNLLKMMISVLKDKKSYHNDTEENLHFKQSPLNYINNQKQKKNTED